MDGILPLYKPKGMTSHDCVMKVRRLLKIKKVGHTGTLDPSVEGVLPICIGEATKVIPYLLPLDKVYIADVYLGKSTTTEDADGEVVEEKVLNSFPTDQAIRKVLAQFHGTIAQTPPMYSAIRVNGKRLYEYARENIEVERPTRDVTIHELSLLNENRTDGSFRIKVRCSKGTYIRTLAVDIGASLGYPAHMSFLKRIETDGIKLSDTVTFEQIEVAVKNKTFSDTLLSIEKVLGHLYHYEVDERMVEKVLQGQKFPLPDEVNNEEPFKMMHQNKLLAIYEQHPEKPDEIKPVRVFNMHK